MKKLITALILALFVNGAKAGTAHPMLLLTKQEVDQLKAARGTVPSFDQTIECLFSDAAAALKSPLSVPMPVDGGGGIVHEQHKSNQYAMFNCAIAWQLTGDKRYADRVADLLEAYAKLYPTLGLHPVKLSPVPGRLFWQTLNESVWLVHVAVAYDCVYDALTQRQRANVEKNLLLPMALFIMDGTADNAANRKTFNKMHNHATWATAAVGMTGLAIGDDSLVSKALYGTDGTGRNGGFLRQMDCLFSPDGYFTEGAYYQRYAIWPFVIFAYCIDHCRPQMEIFDYRNGILAKALNVLIQMSYGGEFFHINDALAKGLSAQELVYAVDILYAAHPDDKSLLSVAKDYQHAFLPTAAGLCVASDIEKGEARPVNFHSAVFSDGREGKDGGIAIIRSTNPDLNSAVTLKATAHGLSHGHFDKLTMAYYDNGNEILIDYGASRFLNLEAKNKGHYTRENETFAKQTVAHNAIVVDESSCYGGDIKVASHHHADILYSHLNDDSVQVVMAGDTCAWPGVKARRTLAYISVPFLQFPLIIDVLQADSRSEHQYDYPMWYKGHLVSTNFPYAKADSVMRTLGTGNGYQHIWKEAWGKNSEAGTSAFTFVNGNRLYTLSVATTPVSDLVMLRTGANDPDFNLRSETGFMVREKAKRRHTFATSIETHGDYDVRRETSANLTSSCLSVEIIVDNSDYTVARASYKGGHTVTLCLANADTDSVASHSLTVGDREYRWNGPCGVFSR